jgi:dTDP-4-dehydrorhamnose 3,5-epimerase
MKLRATPLDGVLVVEPSTFRDSRGFFLETFNIRDLAGSPLDVNFVQDNHSRSFHGVLRGLHYQLANPQGKLVHVANGRIFDVAVDIRRGSPSFGRWFGTELSDDNLLSLWIPPGFAHGFCVLSELADVIYKCTTLYEAADDRGVAWNDPRIGITWPITEPILSSKDSHYASLSDDRTDLPSYA